MAEVLYYAIPAFVLLLVMELLSFKYLRDDDLVGYEARDTRTSLTMVRYGLTKNIRSFRPAKVAFHEFVDLAHDVRAAKSWRDKFGYVFRGSGLVPGRQQ